MYFQLHVNFVLHPTFEDSADCSWINKKYEVGDDYNNFEFSNLTFSYKPRHSLPVFLYIYNLPRIKIRQPVNK